jgi:carboxymethylenebutenolidase
MSDMTAQKTGRPVRLPVVMGFDNGKVAFERIYWDQACALLQVGLLDGSKLPVTGAVQAEKVLDKDPPANELLKRSG